MPDSEAGSDAPTPDAVAASDSTDQPATDAGGGFARRHRRALGAVVAAIALLGLIHFVLPQIMVLGATLRRLRDADVWWLILGVVLESASIFGQVVLLRGVFSGNLDRVGWRLSCDITLAGSAATKLLATAGAGGVALTVWALRSDGLPGDEVATGMVCYDILTYFVYMMTLAIVGFGLWLGFFSGPAPLGITLIPAIFGTVVMTVVGSMLFVDKPVERWLLSRADAAKGRAQRWLRRLASWPRTLQGGLTAGRAMIRRRDVSLLGPVAGWGFDIGTLWASFHAFGHPPSAAVLVMAYYVGTLANTLPLPGGVGGVESGMIGSFLAFGVNGSLAVLAVLAYRTISYWLPTIPGTLAYFRLRRIFAAARDTPADVGEPPVVSSS
ncbi:MAG TPA: lysylphosphatidylglycerol synthase transmembrane domain-containing protein [Solirubrobacteraceae bacterium]|nr:lysylphosphatidylglycerol synthase transmembrane domain-containing protein [Solirubrobacteraceae bacterium]